MRIQDGRLLLSPTELATADRCGAWHGFKYQDGLPEDPRPASLAFTAGRYAHQLIEGALKDFEVDQNALWGELWAETTSKLPEDQARDRCDRLVEGLMDVIDARYAEILLVEDRVMAEIDLGIVLRGYVDLVGRRHDGVLEVLDLKISAQKLSKKAARKHSKQLTAYKLGVPAAGATAILAGTVSESRKPRSEPTTVELIPVEIGPLEEEALISDALALVDQARFGHRRFTGVTNGTCTWCPFASRCPMAGGREVGSAQRRAA